MPNIVKRFSKIHLTAGLLLLLYFALGNTVMALFITRKNFLESFWGPWIYGSLAAVAFLYIFCHESFFDFAPELRKKEMKSEKKLLKRFKQKNRWITTLIIAILGGPILSALTTRLLLNTSKYKYLFVVLANVPATVFGIAKYRWVLSGLLWGVNP